MPASVLLVDSSRAAADSLVVRLRAALPGVTTIIATTVAEGCRLVERAALDCALLSDSVRDQDWSAGLTALRKSRPALPVVVLAETPSITSAVLAIRLGASDYLERVEGEMREVVAAVCALVGLGLPVASGKPGGGGAPASGRGRGAAFGLARIVGESSAIRAVRRQIAEVAASDVSVLILGETGTGKGIAARAIHDEGPRASKPFGDVNCAEFPDTLFEAELFGHLRGAYTGAYRDNVGLARAAHGGTLFLDEIGELTPPQQAKLLHMADDGRVRPVGATSTFDTDVRIIAATNRDLRRGMRDGTFRPDLFHRLAVVMIEMPPLRRRREDVPILLDHLLARHAAGRAIPRVGEAAIAQLQAAPWPGNVRELESVVQRALVRDRSGFIEAFEIDAWPGTAQPPTPERERLAELLHRCSGKLGAIATELGVDVRTVQRRLKAFGLRRRDFASSTRLLRGRGAASAPPSYEGAPSALPEPPDR